VHSADSVMSRLPNKIDPMNGPRGM
jgi:hypothetical protein